MIIFLDIDGVLNKKSQWKNMFSLDDVCIKEFCIFAKKINAKIVLTSTWKNGFVESKSKNNSLQIQKLEIYFTSYGLEIIGCTPTLPGRTRDKEIERYIYLNNVSEYLVVDDDRLLFEKVNKSFYFINPLKGFTSKDRKGCMKCI